MTRAPHCIVCGSAEISPKSHRGGDLCERCLPVQDHVISNRNGPNETHLARCACGWESRVYWSAEMIREQNEHVLTHWQIVVAQAAISDHANRLAAYRRHLREAIDMELLLTADDIRGLEG